MAKMPSNLDLFIDTLALRLACHPLPWGVEESWSDSVVAHDGTTIISLHRDGVEPTKIIEAAIALSLGNDPKPILLFSPQQAHDMLINILIAKTRPWLPNDLPWSVRENEQFDIVGSDGFLIARFPRKEVAEYVLKGFNAYHANMERFGNGIEEALMDNDPDAFDRFLEEDSEIVRPEDWFASP